MFPDLPVRSTANPSPPRRAGSIRRTSSIDVTWIDGIAGDRMFEGRARDLIKLADGSDHLRAEASMSARIDPARTIQTVEASPAPAALQQLVGEKGGGHLRGVLRDVLPELIARADPLYLLLDDISGTSLVSNWAWSQWEPEWMGRALGQGDGPLDMEAMLAERTNVCWGFQPGFSSHDLKARAFDVPVADGKDLRNPADPEGWHHFPESTGTSFRRARRIDLWREDARIAIEAGFQDSAPKQDGGRAALHEYILRVDLDPESLAITRLDAEPRVLPFRECPGAIANAQGLVGTPLPQVRENVLGLLRGPAGCTHLNDALRALAEAPALLTALDAA